jgi:ribonuclease HI
MNNKFYAVRKGRKPGIYTSWSEAQTQINGYSGAEYKSFTTRSAALQFIQQSRSSDTDMQTSQSAQIQLFSDGGSRNHGNRLGEHVKQDDAAAWAWLVVRDHKKEAGSAGEWGATNNKMEILGLVNALKYVGRQGWQNESIEGILDSKYVLDAIQKNWLVSWQRNGWRKKDGQPVKNQPEFAELARLLPYFPHLTFKWAKGHDNTAGNIYVDQLLNQTMDKMEKQ